MANHGPLIYIHVSVSNISFKESEFCCSEAYKHNLIYKQQLINFSSVCTVFPVSEQLITLSLQV